MKQALWHLLSDFLSAIRVRGDNSGLWIRLGGADDGARAHQPDYALYFDFATWAWFVAVGAKLAGVALQYALFRTIVRRRLAQSAA